MSLSKENYAMNLGDLRMQYTMQDLRRKDLLDNPVEQFQKWLTEAQKASIIEPNAMVLSTCNAKGIPSSRTVLLKHFDEEGCIFFTNYLSRKAQEIQENPYVAITFLWKELERQVLIQGKVEKTSRATSEEYFSKRPRQSQLGAAASQQSQVVPNRKFLEDEYSRLDKLFEKQTIPCPKNWGGFLIKPSIYEFWQGRPNRLHDRFRYRLSNHQWIIERLSP